MTWEWCGWCGSLYDNEEDHECQVLYICPICGSRLFWQRDGVEVKIYKDNDGISHWHGEGEPENKPYIILHIKPIDAKAEEYFLDNGMVSEIEMVE
jgi:DNA-directed RNA polymerase subunit RPC12/RpoP